VIIRTDIPGKRLLAAIACGAALVAAGCGSNDKGKQLPRSSVAELNTSLDSIQRRFKAGDGACQDITEGSDTDVSAVQTKIDALPSNVDKDVRDALEKSFNHLFDLVKQECSNTQTETNTTPAETNTTPTQTTPTNTQTTQTQTTQTQTTTTPSGGTGTGGDKKDKGKGKSKGDAGGDGNGGASAPGGG
jgi:outer membrane murein-binding lipoprotein Lpp